MLPILEQRDEFYNKWLLEADCSPRPEGIWVDAKFLAEIEAWDPSWEVTSEMLEEVAERRTSGESVPPEMLSFTVVISHPRRDGTGVVQLLTDYAKRDFIEMKDDSGFPVALTDLEFMQAVLIQVVEAATLGNLTPFVIDNYNPEEEDE